MKKFLLLFNLIPVFYAYSQNMDSLYTKYLQIKNIPHAVKTAETENSGRPIKCGFGIINQVRLNYNNFSPLQKSALNSLGQRPVTDTSFVSPSGKFRIHFFKSGPDRPIYDINDFAKAADSSYNYEVNYLGYPAPPKDYGKAGDPGNPDDKYDIFILNLSGGLYGYTQYDSALTSNTYTAFTVVDHEFGTNYYTHGIDAARVTIAHEFHHAIQIGNYIYSTQDVFYHELTSTSMEEFVYPGIDDYINYMQSYFDHTYRTFSNNDGYNAAIWNLFLASEFDNNNVPAAIRGKNIIRRIWELMPAGKRALEAFDDAIQEGGSNFKTEFNKFGQWTYFTGKRATDKYFPEAAKYPMLNPTLLTDANSIKVYSEPVSNNFYQLNDNSTGRRDSIITLISNSDIAGAVSSSGTSLQFKYTLSNSTISGGKQISGRYYSKLESSNLMVLSESNVLSGNISLTELNYVYPQPFNYSINKMLYFPAAAGNETTGTLYIYSISLKLLFQGEKAIIGGEKISWDGIDQDGKKLATGVYLYVTKSGDNIKKGKFVIYND